MDLERHVVDVTRVAINRLIDEAPEVRTEGDTTIVPVVEGDAVPVPGVMAPSINAPFMTNVMRNGPRCWHDTAQAIKVGIY